MKFLKYFLKIIIFVLGATIALWIFMPWDKVGEYAVLSVEKRVSSALLSVRHSTVNGSWYGPNIKINDFSAKMALAGGEFSTISLTPSIMQSIIRFSPVVSISFSGGKLSLPGGIDADIGSGRVEVSFKNGILQIKDLKSDGELSLNGFIVYDVNGMNIDNADLMIKSPAKVEQALNMAKIAIPSLNQESSGQWRIKKEKSNG